LREHRLEPKKMRFVLPYADSPPNLVLISAQKNSGSFLKVEKPLIIRNRDGSYTREIYDIYGMGGAR
jgi:tRNA1Val (adenine37-N6)-methyltransferase